jgi:nitrogen PTS system EIIA component
VNMIDMLELESIAIDLTADTKKEALSKILDLIKKKFTKIDRQKILKIILDREKLSSTAFDHYIAIPHARLDFINFFIAAVGRFKDGIEFDSLDTDKTYFVFLLLGPKDKPEEFLKLLANISRLLKDENTKELLLKTDQIELIYRTFKNIENSSMS